MTAAIGRPPSFPDFSSDDLSDFIQRMMQAQQAAGGLNTTSPALPIRGAGEDAAAQGVGPIDKRRPPAVAMDEGQTQGLERAMASPQDQAALGPQPGSADALQFDRRGLGGGLGGFTGSADPYGSRAVPMPPQRPSDLSMPDPAATGGVQGMNPSFKPTGNSVNRATPPLGSAPTANVLAQAGEIDPLTRQPLVPQAGGAQPTMMQDFLGRTGLARAAGVPQLAPQAAPGQPAPQGPGAPGSGDILSQFFGKSGLGGILDANPNLMTSLATGLLTQRGVGRALGAGLQANAEADQRQAAQAIAGQRAAIEGLKFRQAQEGQNQTINTLIRAGHSPEVARSLVMGALGGNSTALNNALGNAIPKTPDAPSGYRPAANGGLDAIPGGPADLKTIEAVKSAGKDGSFTLGQGQTRYGDDGKVVAASDPAPKITTTRNADGSSTARMWDPATQSFREVPGGGGGAVDTTGVPAGVDPRTFRVESAKAAVAEGKAADQRAFQAAGALPILDRAQSAYERLATNKGIGPFQSSQVNRMYEGALGHKNEIDRQDFEAANK